MKNWYVSVNYGLEKIVGDIVKTYGAHNIKVLDSALTFSCAHEIDIKCINNLFVILSAFHCENITEAAKKISGLTFSFPHQNGKTFRVIVMDCGKLRAVPQNIMVEVEKNISRQTKLEVHRANPDIEMWINRRSDGATFFMIRVKKHSPFDKKLKQGELRPDVVGVMLHMARINNKSIIVDMFGGWGAIAAALEDGQYHKIFTGDINDECVKYQKTRLKNKRNCAVQKWNAHSLPLDDNSVDSVVTDPPWGEYEKINASQFYDDFIAEAARILRPKGTLIFLSSMQKEASGAMEKYGFSYEQIPLKINGKNTILFCAERADIV